MILLFVTFVERQVLIHYKYFVIPLEDYKQKQIQLI